MGDPSLENGIIDVRRLIDDYRSGRIVIPEFQRDYVWKKKQAAKLIDSLYRNYPISSLLLWITSESVHARRNDPRPDRSVQTQWLIDGQQRMITLTRCLSGEEDIEVVFHPEDREFQLANAATRRDPNWFRLADIWDDNLYIDIRKNLSEANRHAREREFDRVRKILDYKIPIVKMVDYSFQDAVHAFHRINAEGRKLKKADEESAQIAARHSGFIAGEVVPFLDEMRKQGLTRLNVMHLFRACAFIAHPDGRTRTPLHELDTKDVLEAWETTKRAAREALNLVRSEFHLLNMDILWSGALLVPIMAMCATQSTRTRDNKAIAAWLALAALLHRYSVGTESALDQDLRACRNTTDPIGALLGNLRREHAEGQIKAFPDDFDGALADKGILFGVYVACHHRGILDLFSNGNIIMQERIDRHHILPRGQFSQADRASADCIANIAFVSATANRSISMSGPEVYLPKISKEILESQCIPTDSRLWCIDRASDFWEARRELLSEAFNDYLRHCLPRRRMG